MIKGLVKLVLATGCAFGCIELYGVADKRELALVAQEGVEWAIVFLFIIGVGALLSGIGNIWVVVEKRLGECR